MQEAAEQALQSQLDEIEGQMVGHVRENFGELDSLLQSARSLGSRREVPDCG